MFHTRARAGAVEVIIDLAIDWIIDLYRSLGERASASGGGSSSHDDSAERKIIYPGRTG